MRISRRYTSAEVLTLFPDTTLPEVHAAVASIYAQLAHPSLAIAIPPAPGKAAATHITAAFSDSENPRDNITDYKLLRDGLTRIHPAGYAALLHAAVENDIGSLNVTSCWRPLLGSIAHRAGLGLDVNYLGEIRLNREKLRKPQAVNAGDPWYLDLNTRDPQPAEPNLQRSTPTGSGQSIEQLHANHLHITVDEPKVL